MLIFTSICWSVSIKSKNRLHRKVNTLLHNNWPSVMLPQLILQPTKLKESMPSWVTHLTFFTKPSSAFPLAGPFTAKGVGQSAEGPPLASSLVTLP